MARTRTHMLLMSQLSERRGIDLEVNDQNNPNNQNSDSMPVKTYYLWKGIHVYQCPIKYSVLFNIALKDELLEYLYHFLPSESSGAASLGNVS